ncbi:MAG: biotin transporter BioY [Gemmatimonadota bacterium]|nr:biotin transporter BioY [Gemmatimonadota bacterium]
MTNSVQALDRRHTATAVVRKVAAVLGGALLVAFGAQASVPLPGTPVPITLQVPAVLIVGGLLGPRLGAASLVTYLLAGAAGLPVFAPIGLPGVARLFGPTGGYLLALPLAAAIAGRAAIPPVRWTRLAVGLVLATVTIHAGGVAQLAILGGDLRVAVGIGSVPFLLGDVAKLLVAGLVIGRYATPIRRALL